MIKTRVIIKSERLNLQVNNPHPVAQIIIEQLAWAIHALHHSDYTPKKIDTYSTKGASTY